MRNLASKSLKPSTDFLGLDTETVLGYARLLCLSDGRIYRFNSLSDVIGFLSEFFRNRKTYFFAWNADFDIQALLKWFPKRAQDLLLKGVEFVYNPDERPFSVQYIKGKYFQFDGNYIFDALQYYGTSLKVAAVKYLPEDEGKLGFDAAMISEENVFSQEVLEYCSRDALTCLKLFLKFWNALPEQLKAAKPISNAFYAYVYFRSELSRNKGKRDVNDYFRNAYHGGRFEIFERGYFRDLYVYDINSAYPFEISKLRGLDRCHYVNLASYIADAAYSVYKIKTKIEDKFVSPLLFNNKGLCCYPSGHYEGYITKGEYERIKDSEHTILEGFHVFANGEYPFAEKVAELYRKRKTSGFSLPFKIILNSLYGKTGQATVKYVKSSDLGEDMKIVDFVDSDGVTYVKCEDLSKSNFVYASEITARTRLRLYDLVARYRDSVVMVQTDSIISKNALPLELSADLGEWRLEKWDEAILVGSGIYFYRKGREWFDKFRGFNFKADRVQEIMRKVLRAKTSKVSFQTLKRFSIQEANRLHDDALGNQILEVTRRMDLNFDRKRVWLDKWERGSDIKKKRIKSLALFLDNLGT